jgi:hypothetical protein
MALTGCSRSKEDPTMANDANTQYDPTPAANDEWLSRFKPLGNVWNHYTEFKVEKLTTDKLAAFLNDLAEGHAYLEGGEPSDVVTPATDGWEVIQLDHIGGRDWVAVLGNIGA